jgi:hypothetical protein
MALTLTTNLSIETAQARIQSLIEIERPDTLQTHFDQIFRFKDDTKVLGTMDNHQFKIWISDHNVSTGIFYPIIKGKLIPTAKGLDIKLTSRLNIIGRIVFLLLSAVIAYYLITHVVIQKRNDLQFLIPRFLIALIMYGLFTSIPTFIYLRTSRIVKRHVIEGIKNKK